jgi:Domain of unknown function (DUF3471)
LRFWILDAFLNRPRKDWSESVRKDYTHGFHRLVREAKTEFDAKRPPEKSPPRLLTEYAGKYESKLYGVVEITAKENQLSLQFGTRFQGQLQHWQDDAFRAQFPSPRFDDWMVTFAVNDEKVTGLHVKESPWAPAWYEDQDDLGEFQRQ